MKICSTCKEEKELTEFHVNRKNKDRLRYSCKECALVYQKKLRSSETYKEHDRVYGIEYRKKRNEKGDRIIHWITSKYNGIPCMDCKKTWPWCAMDFDHRAEEVKSFEISYMNNNTTAPESIARIEKEISKCDLVCASCHRIRTWIERK